MQDLLEATRRATADIRQKDPLAHRRRRRENRPHIPKDVHKDLLGEAGENLTEEDMKKANGLWKMLDDMYEADPDEYKNFIEQQMKAGRDAGFKLPGEGDANVSEMNDGEGGTTTTGSTERVNVKPRGGSFTPNCGFVVKARKMYTGDKVFLNICSHPGVQIPLTAGGSNVDENTPGQFARQIPLLIGQPRDGMDKSNQPIVAVDCVFNPWVITAVSRDNMFKVNTVELAMQWLYQDHQIRLQKNWKIIKSKYKCGGGKIGNKPIPFPIEDAKAQSAPQDDTKTLKTTTKKKKTTKKKPQKSAMSSPSELLKQVRSSDNNNNNNSSSSSNNNNSSSTSNMPKINISSSNNNNNNNNNKKKPLIQDLSIHDDNESKDEVKSNNNNNKKATTTTKKKKKKKKVIKGGFLNNSKDALYPTGSNEGAPKGLLSKCKVVDTTKMNEDELKKTMEAYAAPGGNRVPRKKKPPVSAPPPAPIAKTKQKKKKKKKEQQPKVNPVLDAEFDEMMEMADPDLAKSNVQNGMGGTGVAEFDALTNLLSGHNSSLGDLSDMAKMTDLRQNFENERQKFEQAMPPPSSAVAKEEKKKKKKTKTTTTKKKTKVKKEVVVVNNETPAVVAVKEKNNESYQDLMDQGDVWELE